MCLLGLRIAAVQWLDTATGGGLRAGLVRVLSVASFLDKLTVHLDFLHYNRTAAVSIGNVRFLCFTGYWVAQETSLMLLYGLESSV